MIDRKRSTRLHKLVLSNTVVFTLLLAPFFEPGCLDYLVHGAFISSVASVINRLFQILQVAISMWAIGKILSQRGFDYRKHVFIFAALVYGVVASFINTSFSFGCMTIGRSLSILGEIALLYVLLAQDRKALFRALFVLFSAQVALSLISVFLFPHGIDPSYSLPIYFFGGKNSIFLGISPFLISLPLFMQEKFGDRATYLSTAFAALFSAFTALYVHSASSTICFASIGLIMLLANSTQRPLFPFRTVLVVIYLLLIVIVVFQGTSLLAPLLEMIGRDATFSGRTHLWAQAVSQLKDHPVFGIGNNMDFVLGVRSQIHFAHPHCAFLEYALRYGLPPLVFIIVDQFSYSMGPTHATGSEALLRTTGTIMLVFLFHSCFDVTNLHIYFLLRFLLLHVSYANERRKHAVGLDNNDSEKDNKG